MIPDNIQANIMKYLNNGVSGSSQEQKPVVSDTIYEFVGDYAYYTLTNNHITEDNQFIINMGMYRTTTESSKPYIGIFNIENGIQGSAYRFYEIPTYNNYIPDIPTGTINRDEEGRFYGIISYRVDETHAYNFLVIFNDFITDGIIQINKAYNLHDYNLNINNNDINFNIFNNVLKRKNSSDYILYNNSVDNIYINNAKYIGILTINVNTNNEIKLYYNTITNYDTSRQSGTTIYSDENQTYGLIEYLTTSNQYKVDKIILENSNEQVNQLIVKSLYTFNNVFDIRSKNTYTNYNFNGQYLETILQQKDNTNKYTFRLLFTRTDGTNKNIVIPFTITTTNNINVNYTINSNLLFMRVIERDGQETTISDSKKLYTIDLVNNIVKYIQDIDFNIVINFARIEILKQFNLYYCFALNPANKPRLFIVKDVPIYGRDCILKQKLLNSKLFRIIKKYRNRRANIQ